MTQSGKWTQKIGVLTGPPGCRKTTHYRTTARANPDIYVYVAPVTELLDEQAAAYADEAPWLDVTVAHHESPGQGDVQRKLDDAADRFESKSIQHAVVLASHETLMGKDLSRFAGAHLQIDEPPDAVKGGRIKVSEFPEFMKQIFTLERIGSGWSELTLSVEPPKWQDIKGDSLFSPLAEPLKLLARGQSVYVNCETLGKEFSWCSLWLPTELGHFKSVTFAGASYLTSLGAIAAKRVFEDDIEFNEILIPMHRTAQPTVRLHYFTSAHEGSTTFWQTPEGNRCIMQVCNHLAALSPPLAFWSANKPIIPLLLNRLPGDAIKPKAAGLNKWRDETRCAMLYSSKPTPADASMIKLLSLQVEEILGSREDEDIFQFATRGAIRNPDFGGDYDVYLYSRRQAEKLRDRLISTGLENVSLAPEPGAGIMDVTRRKKLPISQALKEKKAAERKAQQATWVREKRAAKALAAGRGPGKPGRPRPKPDPAP
jgi:hypothetical protein